MGLWNFRTCPLQQCTRCRSGPSFQCVPRDRECDSEFVAVGIRNCAPCQVASLNLPHEKSRHICTCIASRPGDSYPARNPRTPLRSDSQKRFRGKYPYASSRSCVLPEEKMLFVIGAEVGSLVSQVGHEFVDRRVVGVVSGLHKFRVDRHPNQRREVFE